ncbi:response regulator [Telluribacter sp.]|jgi:PleD family two-component response regulator|uniref:response regulator n=1 Tax=Telluribacter sp. TaxID=1978767 RepID=UPI002E154247|nr:response regulator [Telluribacter sp.]
MSATCLLIDDDQDEHFLFASALREIDPALACISEESALEAVNKLKTNLDFTPEFIFLDLNMPGLDGKWCLANLKKIERLREVPIIIYSTSRNKEDVCEAKNLGSAGYVVKPGAYQELKMTLKNVLGNLTRHDSYFFYQ